MPRKYRKSKRSKRKYVPRSRKTPKWLIAAVKSSIRKQKRAKKYNGKKKKMSYVKALAKVHSARKKSPRSYMDALYALHKAGRGNNPRGSSKVVQKIPKNFAVQPLRKGQKAKDKATCGHCGLSWDDAKPTQWTPAPSGRCPFEYFHIYK